MNVLITGFKSETHARAFINWYCGQGEQDWWNYDDELAQTCDAAKTYPIDNDNGTLIMVLKGGD